MTTWHKFRTKRPSALVPVISLIALWLFGSAITVDAQNGVSFKAPTNLVGESLSNPTSLQFGPDGRLYVAQQNGQIKIYTIQRNAPSNPSQSGSYVVTATETLTLVQQIPNYNDDGTRNTGINTRQITGLLVIGTAQNPILYVSSSDPRIGAGGGGSDLNLDTNSGIVSRLTWNGSAWAKIDLVRGLPRSEENHSVNGMQISGNVLYLAVGGHTNAGAPSNNFARITEYALSAAVVSIDLNAINALPTLTDAYGQQYKYDLPTLDDPTRPNTGPNGADPGDPFGGNDGLNQAMLVPNGPVQIYSSGYRNAYDLAITETPGRAGRMYVIDNGPNQGWGGYPQNEGPNGICTNNYVVGEPGSNGPGVDDGNGPQDAQVNNLDNLHLVTGPGYYAGHPNPVRGNPAGAGLYTFSGSLSTGTGVFRTTTGGANPLPANWPPVPVSMANPVECDYRNPGVDDGSLIEFNTSTNGIAEYTASNFGGAFQGWLLLAGFNGTIYKVQLNQAGTQVMNNNGNPQAFASNFGSNPLDVTTQGDGEIFAGTIWAATYGSDNITIWEPSDFSDVACTGAYSDIDEDGDGYTNADEIDNGTDPCSAADAPPDYDGDLVSDLNDPDDDNDGIPDVADAFARDATNGSATHIPVFYGFEAASHPDTLLSLGFTGLMTNGSSDYLTQFNADDMIAGGAGGVFTVSSVTSGSADGSDNSQHNAFQFGVSVSTSTPPFMVHTRLNSPYFNGNTPIDNQAMGVYIGSGDQDNFLKLAVIANGGQGGLQVFLENGGSILQNTIYGPNKSGALNIPSILGSVTIDLYLLVDPAAGTVQPAYSTDGGATITHLGTSIILPNGSLKTALQNPLQALAVGVISTASGSNTSFGATWDFLNVQPQTTTAAAAITITPSGGINASTYGAGSFQITNNSASGQLIERVVINIGEALFPDVAFDPVDGTPAGDNVGKNFTPDSGSGSTTGVTGHSFSVDNAGGWEILEITFSDFDPGETLLFSIDIDPTSAKGDGSPGNNHSGSISGVELIGSHVTVEFSDNSTLVGEPYRIPGSSSGSTTTIASGLLPAPTTQILNVPNLPAVINAASQTVRVSGRPNTAVRLLRVEGAMYVPLQGPYNGVGFDVDPFEANTAIVISEITNATTNGSGLVDLPVTLTRTNSNAGFNYIVAVFVDSQGRTGLVSAPLITEYNPSASTPTPTSTPSPDAAIRINAGGPQVTVGGVTWGADQYFSGGQSYTNPSVTQIAGTTSDVLYLTERTATSNFGSFSYNIPVSSGSYIVNLYFAEIYWGATGGGSGGTGKRVFDVNIEGGAIELDDFDLNAVAAPMTAIVRSFDVLVNDDSLNIAFTASVDRPKVSAIEVIPVPPSGSAPIANAGPDQTVADTNGINGEPVQLNGSASTDSDGTIVSYVWKENGVTIATGVTPTVTLSNGPHTITLTVTDNDGLTHTDTVLITVQAPPPVGPTVSSLTLINTVTNQPIDVIEDGSVFVLSELPAGINVRADTNPAAVGSVVFGYDTPTTNFNPSFKVENIAPYALFGDSSGAYNPGTFQVGEYMITATAYTGSSGSGTAGQPTSVSFTVVATPPNQAPTADAGAPQTVIDADNNGSELVTLNGSASVDADGTIVSYQWYENAALIATGATPTVSLTVGTHIITLIVTDDDGATDDDVVEIVVGAGSTPTDSATPTPSATPTASATPSPAPTNAAPVANAGPDQVVTDKNAVPGESVQLDGSASADSDGTITSYQWYETGALIATGATPIVNLSDGQHVITLVVTDDDGASASDTVTITVQAPISGPAVVSLTLINAITDQPIGVIQNGAILALSQLPAAINVRADTVPATVGSVGFGYDTPSTNLNTSFRTENGAPYALFGDTNGNYANGSFVVGQYTIVATAYSGANKTGTASQPLTITFTVVSQPPTPTPTATATPTATPSATPANAAPVANAGPDQTISDTNGAAGETVFLSGAGSTDSDGTIVSYVWTENGAQIATGPTPSVVLSDGMHTITLTVTDDDGASSSDTVIITVQAPATGPRVVSFTLINAITDQPIGVIQNGAVLALAQLPAGINIRADVAGGGIGSVVFGWDTPTTNLNPSFRIENGAPYALFSDNNGDYFSATLTAGQYTLIATPYSGGGGTGTPGLSLTINFSVVSGAGSGSSGPTAPLQIAPTEAIALPATPSASTPEGEEAPETTESGD